MAKFLITFEATYDVEVEIDDDTKGDQFNAAIRKARRELDPDIDWDLKTGKRIEDTHDA